MKQSRSQSNLIIFTCSNQETVVGLIYGDGLTTLMQPPKGPALSSFDTGHHADQLLVLFPLPFFKDN